MQKIQSLCLYCGSRQGADPAFRAAAERLGRRLGDAGIRLVFGAGSIGLMGVAARAALDAGGEVVGIIPRHLDRVEVTMQGLTELHVVESMHERKALMFRKSDAFIILPGGIGTIDEFVEITTWRQLGLHDRPIVLVDTAGYWGPFLALMDHIVATGMASPETRGLFRVADDVDEALDLIEAEGTTQAARPALF